MKILFTLLFFVFILNIIYTQNQLELLNTNTSPAFVLLGNASTDIPSHSSIGSYLGSIQNSTSNFSTIPDYYAVDFALNPKKVKKSFNDNSFNKVLNANLFLGYKKTSANEKITNHAFAVGYKLSLLKKHISKDTIKKYQEVKTKKIVAPLTEMNKAGIEMIQKGNLNLLESYNNLESAIYSVETIVKEDSKEAIKYDSMFIDSHIGLVNDWDVTNANSIFSIPKFSVWSVGGLNRWEYLNLKLHATARYIYDLNSEFSNFTSKHNGDIGIKGTFDAYENKLNISFEYIGRSNGFKFDKESRTSKFLFNISFKALSNGNFNFTFGKDFDNNISKDGNILSLINFVKSFGNDNKK